MYLFSIVLFQSSTDETQTGQMSQYRNWVHVHVTGSGYDNTDNNDDDDDDDDDNDDNNDNDDYSFMFEVSHKEGLDKIGGKDVHHCNAW